MAGFLSEPNTVDCPALVRRALSRIGDSTEADGYKFLGSSPTDQQANLVDEINGAVQDVLDENPKLTYAHGTTLSVTAEVRTTNLPSDLRQAEIYEIRWNDTNEQINVIGADELLDLGGEYRDEDNTVDRPEYVVIHWTTPAQLHWYPMPAANLTVYIKYRQQETKFVVGDLSSTTNKLLIANFAADAVVECLAWRLLKIKDGPASKSAQAQYDVYQLALQKVDRAIRIPKGKMPNMRFGFEGYPSDEGDPFESFQFNP